MLKKIKQAFRIGKKLTYGEIPPGTLLYKPPGKGTDIQAVPPDHEYYAEYFRETAPDWPIEILQEMKKELEKMPVNVQELVDAELLRRKLSC